MGGDGVEPVIRTMGNSLKIICDACPPAVYRWADDQLPVLFYKAAKGKRIGPLIFY
jgi:hypothetical protein